MPVPVQVGVQPRLFAPRGVPRAVLEAQLISDLAGAHEGRHRGDRRSDGCATGPRVPLALLTWRGSGAVLWSKRCLKTTAASTLPERLSDLTYSSKSRSEAKP